MEIQVIGQPELPGGFLERFVEKPDFLAIGSCALEL
jgi:hypothetical protein